MKVRSNLKFNEFVTAEINIATVERRFSEVPRDWGNWFVISRFFFIHNAITG